MANRYVRIYGGAGEHEGTDIIGFSASASDTPDTDEFRLFMASRGYTANDVEAPEGSMSLRHIEVRPPLTDEHLQEFGDLCLRIVDSGSNETIVYNNRGGMPAEPFAPAPVVARGY